MATIQEMRDREAAEAAEANGGKTIEDMANDPDGLPDEEDTAIYIEGSQGQLSLAVGGRKPDQATFKMKGAEVKVSEGQYHKGETVTLQVIARIDEVKFIDIHDEYGTVTATKRVHTAKPISVVKVEDADEVG